LRSKGRGSRAQRAIDPGDEQEEKPVEESPVETLEIDPEQLKNRRPRKV